MKSLLNVLVVAAVAAFRLSVAATDFGLRVTDFGAKGDGVTDDTAAIRRAVEALEKGRPKARHCVRRHKVCFPDAPFAAIVFPKGTYRITGPIVVTGDAMLQGEDGATVVNAAPEEEGFYVRDTHNLIVKGLTFVGGLCQIRMWTRNRDCSYLHVADCVFRECRGTSVCSVSYKQSEERPAVVIETACGEERGVPYNNSTLMLVERCRFEGNATALRLYSDGLTVRDCSFVAPAAAAYPQLNVGSGGRMGVEMYFRDLAVDYPSGSDGKTAAILFQGGRGVFENMRLSSSDDLVAFRSLARFNEYHKPSCLDLRNVRLATGAASVFSMADDEFPNRLSVYGLTSESPDRKRLVVFDHEPTRESIDRACADPSRLMREPPEQSFAFVWKNLDVRHFDCTLPAELEQYVRQAASDDWKRPLDRVSGSMFGIDLPTGPVFSGAPVDVLLEKARAAGGGTVVLPSVWQDVKKTLEVPDNTRITCCGRAALWMRDENAPLFRVADGVCCVFENVMMIDGQHAVEVLGDRGRVRLLDCTLLGQKAASVFACGSKPAARRVDMSGGQAFTPYLYRGNAALTVDGYWYEESTERAKGEIRPSYAAVANEVGGEMYLRDFLGVPCYFQHTPKKEAYVFGGHPERRGEFRWIDNHGTYVSVNMRYGGEWGGLTPLYHFGTAKTWIEGGNIELGNVYMKSERAVVVADSAQPDVTVVDAASGHHIEPFQVFHKTSTGRYEVAQAHLDGNYPFLPIVPVWPKGRAGDEESSNAFAADFRWNGRDPVCLDLEASCLADVWLNGVFVGAGPRRDALGLSRQARFPLSPRFGTNRIVIRTRPGHPGFLLARIVEGCHVIARTAVDGDFSCGLPLEERVKPPRNAKDVMPPAASRVAGVARQLHLVGDSTLFHRAEGVREGSWGESLGRYLSRNVAILNWAACGKTVLTIAPSWSNAVPTIASGDVVLFQFGINDADPRKFVDERTFKERLGEFVGLVRARGACPVICSPVAAFGYSRNDESAPYKPNASRRLYSKYAAELAESEHVDYVDMTKMTERYLSESGRGKALGCFVGETMRKGEPWFDDTHPTKLGAETFARLFVADVRQRKLGFATLLSRNPSDETVRWQREIDRAAASGGGRVEIPFGRHEVGQLFLRSGVELHLADGSELLGLPGTNHYSQLKLPFSEGDWGAVLFAHGVTNVAITGRGIVDGRGGLWPHGGFRPRGIFFSDSANIRLEDFMFRDSANWGVVLKRCDGVVVRRITVDSHMNDNNDGIDIEAKNVCVFDSVFDAGDDAICIKSNDPDFAVENVLVSNCVAASHCNGLKLGTASHGTMRNIRFVDCRTTNPRRNYLYREGDKKGLLAFGWQGSDEFPLAIGNGAINVECVDGGTVEDVLFDGIEAEGFRVPIFVRGNLRRRRSNGVPPSDRRVLRDIAIRNVRGAACSVLSSTVTGAAGCEPKGVTLENVEILCRGEASERPVCEPSALYDGFYPDASMFKFLRLPAYGLYIDRADVARCENVRFRSVDADDKRPAIYMSTPASQAARARLSGYESVLELTDLVATNGLDAVLSSRAWEAVYVAVRQNPSESDRSFKSRVFSLTEKARRLAPQSAVFLRKRGTDEACKALETSPYGFRIVADDKTL